MILGGIAAIIFGGNAEGKPLEEVAKPLGVIGKPSEAIFRAGADDRVIHQATPQMPRTRPDDGTPSA